MLTDLKQLILASLRDVTLASMAVPLLSIVVGVVIVAAIAVHFNPKIIVLLYNRFAVMKSGFKIKSITTEDGYIFSYLERGSRSECETSILLLNGFSGSKNDYCIMAEYFPSTLHLISLDTPGHGDTTRRINDNFNAASQAAKIKEFVDRMKMTDRRFHILGISMGGNIAGVYASRYHEDLLSATLLCPSGIKTDEVSEIVQLYQKEKKMDSLPNNLEEMKTMFEYVTHRHIPIPDLILRGFLQLSRPHKSFFEKVVKDLTTAEHMYTLHDSIKDIKCPTLVLWGKQDKILPSTGAKVLKDQLQNGTVHELNECGHGITLEMPREATKLILEFFQNVKQSKIAS